MRKNSLRIGFNHSLSTGLKPAPNAVWRDHWADLCRVAAIFGVVVIHSSGAAFYQYAQLPIYDWVSADFLDSLVRPSVPLFVMVSGALLLQREEEALSKLLSRIGKLLLPLCTWSVLYLLRNSYYTGVPVEWWSITRQPAMYHLWFVYMMIGIYIMLPIFQVIFNAIREREDLKIYVFVLWLTITSVPIYQRLPLLAMIQQSSFFGYGGYFLFGGIIASSSQKRLPSIVWFSLYLLGVLITFALTWLFSHDANAPVEAAYSYFSPNVFMSSIAAFVLFTRASVSPQLATIFSWVSDKTFLIYFVHILVLEYVRYSSLIVNLGHRIPTFFVIAIISAISFLGSLFAACFVRFLPGAKRVFG